MRLILVHTRGKRRKLLFLKHRRVNCAVRKCKLYTVQYIIVINQSTYRSYMFLSATFGSNTDVQT